MSSRKSTLCKALLGVSFNLLDVCNIGMKKALQARVSLVQARAMRLITSFDPEGISLNDLSKLLMLTPGSASKLVERLVQAGMVERKGIANDRRAIRVVLTDLGRSHVPENQKKIRESVDEFLAEMPETEREIFVERTIEFSNRMFSKMLAESDVVMPEQKA